MDFQKSLMKLLVGDKGSVIMMELPTDSYIDSVAGTLSLMESKGFDGVYISFQRPFENIDKLLSEKGVDTQRLMFIDIATGLAATNDIEPEPSPKTNGRCVHIDPSIDVDELIRAVYTSLDELKAKKKFIFIDSLTTITLYKPLSEVMRFSEFLIRTIKKKHTGDIMIFNVSEDLTQKRFIKDIALHVDEVFGTRGG